MEASVTHSPRREPLSRHLFPNRVKKEESEKGQNNKSYPTLPTLPDLPSVPTEPSPKPVDSKPTEAKPDYKKERPLSKSQSMPKLKRDSISFRGRVADGLSLAKPSEAKEEAKTTRSVRIMLTDDDKEKYSSSPSIGASSDSISSSSNVTNTSSDLLLSGGLASDRADLLQPHSTPLAGSSSPSKKHRFMARTTSKDNEMGAIEKDASAGGEKSEKPKLKRTNSEKTGFMILEFRAKNADLSRAELSASAGGEQSAASSKQPLSPRSHVATSSSAGSSARESVSGKGAVLSESLPSSLPSHLADLGKSGSRASLRIIRYATIDRKKSVDPSPSAALSSRQRSSTVQADGGSGFGDGVALGLTLYSEYLVTHGPSFSFSLVQKVGFSKNKIPIIDIISHEVKDTRSIVYTSIIEDLKPLAGFSVTQIGVLKERTLDDGGIVTLHTRNHLPYTHIDESQAPLLWVMLDLGMKKKEFVNEKVLPFVLVAAFMDGDQIVIYKVSPVEEIHLKLPATEERVNSKKKALKKKAIQRDIVNFFSNPTTLVHYLPSSENAIKTVNTVKTNLKNMYRKLNVGIFYRTEKQNTLKSMRTTKDSLPPSMNWYRFLCHLTHRIEDEAEFMHEENELGIDWNEFLVNFYLAPKMHKQEIRQKIGNSLAVIIFNDSAEPFDPSNLFLGEWNVIVCVVQCDVLQAPGEHLLLTNNNSQSSSHSQGSSLKTSGSSAMLHSHSGGLHLHPPTASTSGTMGIESPRRVGSTGLPSVGFSSAQPVTVQQQPTNSADLTASHSSNTLGTTPPNDSLSQSPNVSRSTSRDSLARVGKGTSREHIKVNSRAAFNDTDRSQKHRISRHKEQLAAKEKEKELAERDRSEREISSPPITPRSGVIAGTETVPSLNFSAIPRERPFFPDDDTMEGVAYVEHTPPSSVQQTPRTPHLAPTFESEQATVTSADCIYRIGFFVNYQQKFHTPLDQEDSKELIAEIEAVVSELNCHPFVPRYGLFEKEAITDFILTKVFNTLQKVSKHHAMLRKICFGASASKISGLVESELPDWHSKLASEKKPSANG